MRNGLAPRTEFETQRIKDGLCANCGQPLTGRRRSYCSDKCHGEYWLNHDWRFMRNHVLRRDKLTCANCGLKVKIQSFGWRIIEAPYSNHDGEFHTYIPLVVDHIKAICLGGPEWDENNLQILCKWCNKVKTRRDMFKLKHLKRKNVSLSGLFVPVLGDPAQTILAPYVGNAQ